MLSYPPETTLEAIHPDLSNIQRIQTGGQKAVYRATFRGQSVALKLIAIDSGGVVQEDGDDLDISAVLGRAIREVGILEQVDTPVLTRLGPLGLDKIQIGGDWWIYFTEEWIDGIVLSDMIRDAALPPNRIARLGVDLVSAACWLSGRGIVHRDIKPLNTMWARDRSRFVLLDTGVALDLRGPSLTAGIWPPGTVAYLSPEQMDPTQKRALDFRSDLFAIGVVLYEAASGEHPFVTAGSTPIQAMSGILTTNPPPLTEKVEGFPHELSDFVARLLGKSPHLRYRTCERALATIEHIATAIGV